MPSILSPKKEKAPDNGAFSFLGGGIEDIREYRSFCRFFVMVEKHYVCVLLYRREIAMYLYYIG